MAWESEGMLHAVVGREWLRVDGPTGGNGRPRERVVPMSCGLLDGGTTNRSEYGGSRQMGRDLQTMECCRTSRYSLLVLRNTNKQIVLQLPTNRGGR